MAIYIGTFCPVDWIGHFSHCLWHHMHVIPDWDDFEAVEHAYLALLFFARAQLMHITHADFQGLSHFVQHCLSRDCHFCHPRLGWLGSPCLTTRFIPVWDEHNTSGHLKSTKNSKKKCRLHFFHDFTFIFQPLCGARRGAPTLLYWVRTVRQQGRFRETSKLPAWFLKWK